MIVLGGCIAMGKKLARKLQKTGTKVREKLLGEKHFVGSVHTLPNDQHSVAHEATIPNVDALVIRVEQDEAQIIEDNNEHIDVTLKFARPPPHHNVCISFHKYGDQVEVTIRSRKRRN